MATIEDQNIPIGTQINTRITIILIFNKMIMTTKLTKLLTRILIIMGDIIAYITRMSSGITIDTHRGTHTIGAVMTVGHRV